MIVSSQPFGVFATVARAPFAASPSRSSDMSNQCFTVSASVQGHVGEFGKEYKSETRCSDPSKMQTVISAPYVCSK